MGELWAKDRYRIWAVVAEDFVSLFGAVLGASLDDFMVNVQSESAFGYTTCSYQLSIMHVTLALARSKAYVSGEGIRTRCRLTPNRVRGVALYTFGGPSAPQS